jgi:hypothetical protein
MDALLSAASTFSQVAILGCVIFARFQSKLQIGAQESGPEFGNQFLDRVTFAPEATPAEVTVKPRLAACPVGAFMPDRSRLARWKLSGSREH